MVRQRRHPRRSLRAPAGQAPTAIQQQPTASREDNLFNWNVGIVYKPIPIASFYAAYATSSIPVGNELDATGPDYGGLAIGTAQLDAGEEQGVRGRHEVGAVQPAPACHRGHVPDREGQRARGRSANARSPRPAPIACAASSSGPRARSRSAGASTAAWSSWRPRSPSRATPEFVGRRLANIPFKSVQSADHLQADRQADGRRPGDLFERGLRRCSGAGQQLLHSPTTGASTC